MFKKIFVGDVFMSVFAADHGGERAYAVEGQFLLGPRVVWRTGPVPGYYRQRQLQQEHDSVLLAFQRMGYRRSGERGGPSSRRGKQLHVTTVAVSVQIPTNLSWQDPMSFLSA